MARILILDDDLLFCEALSFTLEEHGHKIMLAHTLERARVLLKKHQADIIFVDVYLPDGNGQELLSELPQLRDVPHAIVVTAQGDPDGAARAIAAGAWDYVQKPAHMSDILLMVDRVLEVRRRRRDIPDFMREAGIIASSNPMHQTLLQVFDASQSDAPVLIMGETGTGKELMARAMHKISSRSAGPFVVVDCGALAPSLLESELFGSVKGAFTGAVQNRPGLVLHANGGTLFLDEIGELAFEQQKVFLRLLQERSFRAVGAGGETRSDFRIIAATNRNLTEMTSGGAFRQDLFFRLQGVRIELPPLRVRGDDIRLIAENTMANTLSRYDLGEKQFSAEALEALRSYAWPGNVRELIHAVEAAVLAAAGTHLVLLQHLPIQLRTHAAMLRLEAQPGEKGQTVPGARLLPDVLGDSSSAPAAAPGAAQAGAQNIAQAVPPFRVGGNGEVGEEDVEAVPLEHIATWKEFHEGELYERKRLYLLRLLKSSGGNVPLAAQHAGVSRQRLYRLLKEHGIFRHW